MLNNQRKTLLTGPLTEILNDVHLIAKLKAFEHRFRKQDDLRVLFLSEWLNLSLEEVYTMLKQYDLQVYQGYIYTAEKIEQLRLLTGDETKMLMFSLRQGRLGQRNNRKGFNSLPYGVARAVCKYVRYKQKDPREIQLKFKLLKLVDN